MSWPPLYRWTWRIGGNRPRPTTCAQVPKSLAVEAVSEGVSAEAASVLAKQRKNELVAQAEAQLVGKRWLPGVLRSHGPEAACTPAGLHLVSLTTT